MNPTYTYTSISLVPRHLSNVMSRHDIDLSIQIGSGEFAKKLRMPILPAPMDTICGLKMCRKFFENDMLGIIHRFQGNEERLAEYRSLTQDKMNVIVAVGLGEEEMVSRFYDLGAKYFILDVANGFNSSVEPMIDHIRSRENTFIICGNVASQEGFAYLSELGVDAIRVGIGNGSMCSTSIMTGVGQGIVTALEECKNQKEKSGSKSLIIADGGVTNVGDIAKALGLGADLVMMGKMFAGTKEAEGNVLKYDGTLYKAYRGSASFAVQAKHKENPNFIEGDETIVKYKGSAQNIINEIEAGLRSSFSYMGAHDLISFQENSNWAVYRLDEKLFK
ncbi:MAG: guanosine monophosphate reductase, partial [Fidelibacterota bacterium]